MFLINNICGGWKQFLFFVMAFAAAVIVSCSGAQDNPAGDKIADNSKNDHPSMANPAAVKCINDGYELVPVIKNGVSVQSFCVNPENGKKCEVWKYFRNECRLND